MTDAGLRHVQDYDTTCVLARSIKFYIQQKTPKPLLKQRVSGISRAIVTYVEH